MSGSIGKVCVYKSQVIALQNQRTGKIEVHSRAQIHPGFLGLYLSSVERTLVEFSKGMGVQNISGKDIENLPFALPPLNEQRRIVAKIEELFSELDKGIENLKQARAQLAVYRQALLKHAFEGKLTADWRACNVIKPEPREEFIDRLRIERERVHETELREWKDVANSLAKVESAEAPPPKPLKLRLQTKRRTTTSSEGIPNTWHILTLEQLVTSIGQGWSPKCDDFNAQAGRWGIIRTTAIQPLEFRSAENKQLPSHLVPRPWLRIRRDDILITRAGPRSRCGTVCRVKDEPRQLMLCDKAYRIRLPESLVSPSYIELLLNSVDVSRRIEALKTGINDSGVNITQSGFLQLTLPIPPLNEQLEIQMRIEQSLSVIVTMEADMDDSLRKAEALRQSILKKAFAGELVPQDPNDEPASVLLARIREERAIASAGPDGGRTTVRGRRPRRVSSCASPVAD